MPNDYINYQNMVTTVTTGLSRVSNVCEHLSMEAQGNDLQNIANRMKEHIFSVGIMGEFKRGKSTVINALLGQEIVPSDVVPCSATLNYVRWDSEKRAEIHFKDGKTKNVLVEELTDYITKITDESAETAASVNDAVVYYPCAFCQNGVQIVDTPGLNDDERMTDISEKVIPTLDAIIMVITADSPFSQSEAEFVRNKVMTSDMGRIIFLVNKIDIIDEDDRDRLLASIKAKIQSSVMKKMENIYGKDSEEYRTAKNKIGNIRLIPVSARQSLKGKLKNKTELTQQSGYPEFEKALSHLLTEERGMLELIHPVNQLLSVCKEGLQTISTRLSGLQMDAEEFEQKQTEALKKIEENRAIKKEEIRSLRNKGKTLYADLISEVAPMYTDMEQSLQNYIEERDISSSDLATQSALDEFSKTITTEINHEIETQLSNQIERLHLKIQERLERDVAELEQASRQITANFEEIRITMSSESIVEEGATTGTLVKGAVAEGIANVVIATASSGAAIIPGIGGAIAGFREHGVKGAVVGGLSGAGLSIAAMTIGVSLGLAALPLTLLGGVVASFGGKAIVRKVFGTKTRTQSTQMTSEKMRSLLSDSISKTVLDLRTQYVIENWLKDNCELMYNAVADDVDREWENTCQTLESTVSQIKIDLQMSTEKRKKTEEAMGDCAKIINEVIDSVLPIQEKLNHSLNSD